MERISERRYKNFLFFGMGFGSLISSGNGGSLCRGKWDLVYFSMISR